MAAGGSNSQDLHATLALSAEEARTGTERTLTLPGGRQLSVTIPPGVRTGYEIRLEGQNTTTYGPPGALILSISIANTPGFNPPANQDNPYATELMQSSLPPPPPTPYVSPSPQPAYPQLQPAATSQYGATPYQPAYPQTYPPQYPSQPARRSPVLAIVIAIVVVLVIIGSAALYVTNVYLPGQIRAQSTATAVVRATTTAQTQANATAQANSNATATITAQTQATATAIAAHQTLFDQSTQKTPDLSDPLQNPSQNNWANTGGSGCTYANNAYHITETKNATILYCTAQNTNFSNFVYQVQMQIIKGDFGGLIFRANATKSQFYLFRISQTTYDLYYYPDNTGKTAKTLASGSVSLTGNNQPAAIAVIAQDSTIDLFVNGKFIATASDPSLTSGQIGLIANEGDNPTEVAYTQAKVWKL